MPAWLGATKNPSPLVSGGQFMNGALVVAVVKKVKYVWVVEALLSGNANAAKLSVGNGQRIVQGRLHVAGPNVGVKEAERLVILRWWDQADSCWIDVPYLELPPDQAAMLARQYRDIVAEQRAVHASADRNEIESRNGAMPWDYLGDEPGQTAWSRHLYSTSDLVGATPPVWVGAEQALPDDGSAAVTCWAQVRDSVERRNRWIKRPLEPADVVMLRPVMISRLLHDSPPGTLLDDSLRPATALDRLSPADRVFGWVSPRRTTEDADAAHRAQLRVVDMELPDAGSAVERLDGGLTIEPLSSPKPSQGRFYVGKRSHDGTVKPLEPRVRRDQFFRPGHTLRGRKVYPHQQWMVGKEAPELRYLLDYEPPRRRARKDSDDPETRPKRDSQNVTLREWIKPGVEFRAVLRIDNLNDLELGALLWLLDPSRLGTSGELGRLKLGGGKPLGFGSVELSVVGSKTRLFRGREVSARLNGFRSVVAPTDWSQLPDAFEAAMPSWFDEVKQAIRAAAIGYPADVAVTYPRVEPGSPGYQWFEENEDRQAHLSLPVLGDGTLPCRP